ncbi:RidA family protein [Pseudonocardia sp. TMWB2A]|uniref:RidA family protein n=1 Tax=Pseudonocardia sp. TMWB2A TaxID=687430 RepID=UPI00307DAF3F
MRRQLIPEGHSRPVGRYSPGLAVSGSGTLIFVTGQVAVDGDGKLLHPGDAGRQASVVFENLATVLAAGGGSLCDLVSIVIYAVDVKRDFRAISSVRDRVLSEPAPASTLVEVAGLVEDGVLLEISGVAVVGDR